MTILHSSSAPASVEVGASPPQASRAQTPGWRDPRLVLGVVIVAGCVLLGARILAGADDTVAVWSVRHDVARGASIERDDVAVVRVHFVGSGSERYLPATDDLAPGTVATHDVAAGELLPRSAITTAAASNLVEVPLSVAPDDLPASVRRGATVDVWVTPKVGATSDGGPPRARLALDDVVVVEVPAGGDSLAPQTTRQVIVGVDDARTSDLAEALGMVADGRVVLTRQSGS